MNVPEKLVSVIIPCYNNAPFIRKCVDSVLAQTYTNLEVLILDDGSDDNPQAPLSDITDPRLHPVITLPHKGVSQARNVGIQLSKGNYIIFIDGDDWVEPTHIRLLVDGLQNADCSMILMSIDYPDRQVVEPHLQQLFAQHPLIQRKEFNLLFDNYLLSSPCNKIYRAEIIKGLNNIQFDPVITYAEDLLFNLIYFQHINTVSLQPHATYHYVKHPGPSGTKRCHRHTAYTLLRLDEEQQKCLPTTTQETFTIMFHHYLWGFMNLQHQNSTLSSAQRYGELYQMLHSDAWYACKQALNNVGISRSLRFLLRLGNARLLNLLLSLRLK